MMQQSWTTGLNPEQLKAVLHDNGPLLILAGAGSGKTTVLVSRTGRLIAEKKAEPRQLCVLTFTNKAARELKSRVSDKLGNLAQGVWAGTFHSFGLQILRQFHREAGLPKHFGILDTSDAQAVVKDLLRDFNLSGKTDFDVSRLMFRLADRRAARTSQTMAQTDDDYDVACEWLLPRYLRRLQSLGVTDFDGLIEKPIELFDKVPSVKERVQAAFTQVMVDEFQDTNKSQLRLIQSVVETHKNITVVGDDDQSIYGWRGACLENILHFPREYENCSVIKLERNYRSTPAILNLANNVISKNDKRHGKTLRPIEGHHAGDLPELFVYESEEQEAERTVEELETFVSQGFSPKQIAILYRSNSQGALIETELRKKRIAYRMTGGTAFFDRKETRDVMAYLRAALSPNETSIRRIINVPSRGIGDATVDALSNLASANKISFFESLRRWPKAEISPSIGEKINSFLHAVTFLPSRVLDSREGPPSKALIRWLDEIGYREELIRKSKSNHAGEKKWNFLEIFGRVLDRFVEKSGLTKKTLQDFLYTMELRNDDVEDEPGSFVSLMTLHACKGLEFPVVFLLGLAEDLLPHNTLGSDVSEERRLFYVGITRAQKRLVLSRVKQRNRHGRVAPSVPSRFLLEIPSDLYKEYELGWRPVSSDQRKALLEAFLNRNSKA